MTSNSKKILSFCAGLTLLLTGTTSSVAKAAWLVEYRPLTPNVPTDSWDCPFDKPEGAYNWVDFNPFSPISVPQPFYDYKLRWSNTISGVSFYVPTIGNANAGGRGNKAVLQALYAIALNRKTRWSDAYAAPVGGLYSSLQGALTSTSKMGTLVSKVVARTGIADGSDGDPINWADGLSASLGFFLSCASTFQGESSDQVYSSINTSNTPNIDLPGFKALLQNGTVIIVRADQKVFNSAKNSWKYGTQKMYIIQSYRQTTTNSPETFTLYDVGTDTTKVVVPLKQTVKVEWSTGTTSNMPLVVLDDSNPNYKEVITGFAGMDPLINHY